MMIIFASTWTFANSQGPNSYRLYGIACIDAYFCGSSSSSFTSLETLYFSNMKEWEEWECKWVTWAFPHLQSLSIVRSHKLKGHLPDQLAGLKRLVIRDCRQPMASAPLALKIHELELEDYGKLQFDYHLTFWKDSQLEDTTWTHRHLKPLDKSSLILLLTSCTLISAQIWTFPWLIAMISFWHWQSMVVVTLTTFPLDLFPKLHSLDLRCRNLKMISQVHTHDYLKRLCISGWPQFDSFSNEGLSAPWLKILSIEGLENLKSLPKCMDIILPSLTTLSIKSRNNESLKLLQTCRLAEKDFGVQHLFRYLACWKTGCEVFSWWRFASTLSYFSKNLWLSKS